MINLEYQFGIGLLTKFNAYCILLFWAWYLS